MLPSQIERDDVRVTAVINEASLITIKHRVDAQWEELIVEELLDRLLFFVFLSQIVQIEEVGQPVVVVVRAAHIALLLADDLAQVFHQEGASWDLFDGHQAPH